MGRKTSSVLSVLGVTGTVCGIIGTLLAIYAYKNPIAQDTQRYDSIV